MKDKRKTFTSYMIWKMGREPILTKNRQTIGCIIRRQKRCRPSLSTHCESGQAAGLARGFGLWNSSGGQMCRGRVSLQERQQSCCIEKRQAITKLFTVLHCRSGAQSPDVGSDQERQNGLAKRPMLQSWLTKQILQGIQGTAPVGHISRHLPSFLDGCFSWDAFLEPPS